LYLQQVGDVSEEFGQQRSAARAEKQSRLQQIRAALAHSDTAEAAARAAEARRLAREQVGTKEAIAKALKLA
jgi:hypothetical protein